MSRQRGTSLLSISKKDKNNQLSSDCRIVRSSYRRYNEFAAQACPARYPRRLQHPKHSVTSCGQRARRRLGRCYADRPRHTAEFRTEALCRRQWAVSEKETAKREWQSPSYQTLVFPLGRARVRRSACPPWRGRPPECRRCHPCTILVLRRCRCQNNCVSCGGRAADEI